MIAGVAGVVLAGGQSSRMGCDKSQLQIAGISLTQHASKILKQAGIKDIYISGKQGIQDQHINKGPLAGIIACLEFLNTFKYVLFTSVDMPLLNKQVFQHLISHQNSTAVYIENYYFPLLISNTEMNRKTIAHQLSKQSLSIKNMLKKLGAVSLTNHFTNEMFLNANTKDDWIKVLDIIGQSNY